MRINLYLATSILLIFSLVIITGVTVSYYQISSRYNNAIQQIQNANKIIHQSQVVMSMVQDVETGQRGFLLTVEEPFLQPYEAAIVNLNKEVNKLNNDIKGDKQLLPFFNKLVPLINQRISISRIAVDLTKSNKQAEAIGFISKGTGKQAMDSIRLEIANIQQIQKQKIAGLDQQLLKTGKKLGIIEISSFSLAALFILFTFYVVVKGINHKNKLEIELKDNNIRLSNANDEINTLLEEYKAANEELNATMDKLNNSYLIIQELNLKLREKVNEKTADLLAANSDLFRKNKRIMESDEILKATNASLYKTVTELNHRNFELDQFVYKISHDLRAPLASIIGLVNISKLENGLPLQTVLDHVENRAHKMDNFIKSVINFSKNARIMVHPTQIEFDDIINDVVDDMRFLKNFESLQIIKNIHCEKGFYSDSDRIKIIFSSLISNAIKFQDLTKPLNYCKIDIIAKEDNIVNIKVSDNGMGIKNEYINRIFDMFFRATEVSDGSGLGLYILKQAIDFLDGTISVESKKGEGSSFYISIPNHPPASSTTTELQAHEV